MARRLAALPKDEYHVEIDSRMFNPAFKSSLEEVHEREVFFGGSGSGKSYYITQRLAIQMTKYENRNLVCLRRQKTDCISSCFADIKGALAEFKLLDLWEIKENPDHVMYNRVNGNIISFEGVDNIEDIKSIKFYNKVKDKRANLTDVWYEEANAEPTIATIRELERRLRDPNSKNRIILSFNPVSRSHWLFDYVTRELPQSELDCFILKTTYKDNKWCPETYKRTLEAYKFNSPYDYQVYTLGNWGTMGQTVFNANLIQGRLDYLSDKIYTTGDFSYTLNANKLPNSDSYRFLPNPEGDITIFELPINKHPYVLSIDTSGEGSDFYACHVMDNINGHQVATFHSIKNAVNCVWQAHALAVMYNNALVAPEINFDGAWTLKAFSMMDYNNLYIRESKADNKHIRKEDKYGWRTGIDNRQLMINDMIFWTGENINCLFDANLLNEMLTFTKQEKKLKGLWMGAESGCFDDLVMSFCILLQARVQQSCEMIADHKKLEGYWTRDELQDALDDKRITRVQKEEYVKAHGYYCEENQPKLERSSRYAR